jgi:hypothetical protein
VGGDNPHTTHTHSFSSQVQTYHQLLRLVPVTQYLAVEKAEQYLQQLRLLYLHFQWHPLRVQLVADCNSSGRTGRSLAQNIGSYPYCPKAIAFQSKARCR